MMRPGCFPYCRDCSHLDQPMERQGHPNPCGRQFWDGPRLHRPAASVSGCDHFDRRSNGPAVPPTGNTNTPARVNTVAGVATAAAMIDDEAA